MENIKIKIKRLDGNNLPLPMYQTSGSAGFDLTAWIKQEVILEPGERKLIPTGLSFEIPIGFEVQIRPRSGLAIKNGISLVNTPGTIDSDYRGEIKIIMINLSTETFVIKNGDRIAQAVIQKVWQADLVEADELSQTSRGAGGFGHTGK
jgi:dUTP pyrophosphatase